MKDLTTSFNMWHCAISEALRSGLPLNKSIEDLAKEYNNSVKADLSLAEDFFDWKEIMKNVTFREEEKTTQ